MQKQKNEISLGSRSFISTFQSPVLQVPEESLGIHRVR